MKLEDLSDEELVRSVRSVCVEERRVVAQLIAHLVEIENRGLDRRECSSLFVYCVKFLGMSDGSAYRRAHAAALVRRFPSLLGRIERGEIHLTSLVLLKDHLTDDNVEELVGEAAGKSKLEIQMILARRAPKPDVPSVICELPTTHEPLLDVRSPTEKLPSRARVEPLSPERHMVQVTVSSEGRAMLERARDLMRHRNPSGDLGVVIESALALLLQKLEKERLGKTTRAVRRAPSANPRSGYVSRAVRREVFERDGERCTHVGTSGQRCGETSRLELDHIIPRAKGGTDEAKNLRVTCRAHNLFSAEQIFGKEHVKRCQRGAAPASAPPPSPISEVLELGRGALVNMGFRDSDARRAIEIIRQRHEQGPTPSIQVLLREALAVLTTPRRQSAETIG